MVTALAGGCGVTRHVDGKTVWAGSRPARHAPAQGSSTIADTPLTGLEKSGASVGIPVAVGGPCARWSTRSHLPVHTRDATRSGRPSSTVFSSIPRTAAISHGRGPPRSPWTATPAPSSSSRVCGCREPCHVMRRARAREPGRVGRVVGTDDRVGGRGSAATRSLYVRGCLRAGASSVSQLSKRASISWASRKATTGDHLRG